MVPQYINNHIHTTYSFSPSPPPAAVYAARMEGCARRHHRPRFYLRRAGIPCRGRADRYAVTVGMECRASMDGTAMEGKRTNNPDQVGVSYMTIQSVPHDKN